LIPKCERQQRSVDAASHGFNQTAMREHSSVVHTRRAYREVFLGCTGLRAMWLPNINTRTEVSLSYASIVGTAGPQAWRVETAVFPLCTRRRSLLPGSAGGGISHRWAAWARSRWRLTCSWR
jgi:hypothetical protein